MTPVLPSPSGSALACPWGTSLTCGRVPRVNTSRKYLTLCGCQQQQTLQCIWRLLNGNTAPYTAASVGASVWQKYHVSTSLVETKESLAYFGKILRIRGPWQTTSHLWGGFPKRFREQKKSLLSGPRMGCAVRWPQRWRPPVTSAAPCPGQAQGAAAPQPRPALGGCPHRLCHASARAVPSSNASPSWQPRNAATSLPAWGGRGLRDLGSGQSSPTASPPNAAVLIPPSCDVAPCPQPTGARWRHSQHSTPEGPRLPPPPTPGTPPGGYVTSSP